MSIQEVEIERTRQKQGEAIKSKDWERVRNKKFQEEDFFWNDSQYIINGNKENQQTQEENQVGQIQQIQQVVDCYYENQQPLSLSSKNQNSRRSYHVSKYTTSKCRTIEIDVTNLNETFRMNQTQELTAVKDQTCNSQNNQSQLTDQRNKNQNNTMGGYNSKVLVWIAKLKHKLKNIKFLFNKIQKSRLPSNEIRFMINDQSDLIDEKESFLENFEKGCRRYIIFNVLKKIPILNLSSKLGFYIKLIIVWLNIIYLLLLSIFFVFSVYGYFSQKTFQTINILWLIEFILSFNSQIQHEMEIITSRGQAFLIYLKKRFIFDLIPFILNSQLEFTQSTLLIQFFQFLKLINISYDLKYIELQLCMRVKRHYIINLISLIFYLFFIAHIISCLWYLIGYVEIHYLQDQNSWLNQDLYINSTWWQIYFSTLYWSLTLMATGSNICSAHLEIMFTAIIMLFTTISFGYFITTIGDILSETNSNDLKRKQDMNMINNYMRQLQASVNLYMQQYYENNFQEEKQNKQEVISKLSTDLQEKLKREQFKEIIPQIDILLNKQISFKALQDIALYIEEEFYFPNQKLKIDNDQCLIFIIQGEVEIQYNEEQENIHNHKNKKIGVGQNLGLIEFITGISSNHILKSNMFTQIVKINRTDFIKIIKQDNQEYQKFCELKDKILFYSNYQDLNFKCRLCHSCLHQDLNCKSVNIDKNQIYFQQSASQNETQKRVTYQRKTIRNDNPLLIQQIISQLGQVFVDDLKKTKEIDILEQFNITVSDSEEEFQSDNKSSDQMQSYKQSQKELESKKSSQINISQRGDNICKRHSIFIINKQSIKDLDQEEQKCLELSNSAMQEQSIEKLNIHGLETFIQNSFTILNENQRITVKDFDKPNNEELENTKISEEKIDSLNLITINRKQQRQQTKPKSIKNLNQKFLSGSSHLFENQDSGQKENFKKEIQKLMDNFKQLNQTLTMNRNSRKSSVFFFNQESNLKKIKICSNQMMYYDFDQLRDYQNYFPQGNSKEVILRQKNQIKKRFKRQNISFLFQNKK